MSSSPSSLSPLSDSPPMEAFCVLEFKTTSPETAADDERTDDEDSFFDLVLKSPGAAATEKDARFAESPDSYANSRPLCKVTLVRSTPKFRVFMLGLRKSVKCERSETKRSPSLILRSPKTEEGNRISVACRDEKKTPGACTLRSQLLKEASDYENSPEKSSRGSIPKYLKLIRPLYLMVWRRQHVKTKPVESSTPPASPVTVPANASPKRISN